jgi:hypothetical protein
VGGGKASRLFLVAQAAVGSSDKKLDLFKQNSAARVASDLGSDKISLIASRAVWSVLKNERFHLLAWIIL